MAKEKSFFEELQEQAAQVEASATERGPELGVGPHQFTIIGGAHGAKDGRDWSCIVARHTNGHEYRIFYNLYWPLKEGELEPRLNVNAFNFVTSFDKAALAGYKEPDFDAYFNALAGKSYEINYAAAKRSGKIYPDFSTEPILLDTLEEELEVDEIDFGEIE